MDIMTAEKVDKAKGSILMTKTDSAYSCMSHHA